MRAHKWIRKFRQDTKLSGRAFAKRIGMDSGNYCQFETGAQVPGDEFIEKFAKACHLSDAEKELIQALCSCDHILRTVIREDER